MIRGSLIIDGHHVYFDVERSGNTLGFTPLHTDAPEALHGVVLARFAELVRATFFAEEAPQEPRATGGPVDANPPYLSDGPGPEMFLPGGLRLVKPNIPAQQSEANIHIDVQPASDINDLLQKLNKEIPHDGSTTGSDPATDA